MPNCITCKQSHFEREEVSDPYNEGMIDAFSVVVDQARVNGCLHEPGGAAAATASIAPPPTAEMAKVAAERAVLRERMELLEKRLRAHHTLILASARGLLRGPWQTANLTESYDGALVPAPPREMLLVPPQPPPMVVLEEEADGGGRRRAGGEPPAAAAGGAASAAAVVVEVEEAAPTEQVQEAAAAALAAAAAEAAAAAAEEEAAQRASKRTRHATGGGEAASHAAASAAAASTSAAATSAAAASTSTSISHIAPADRPPPVSSKPPKPKRSTSRNVNVVFSNMDDTFTSTAKGLLRECGGHFSKAWQPNVTSHVVTTRPKAGANNTHEAGTSAEAAYNCTRTLKYMQAVIHGKWVVDISWLHASRQAGYFVDERPYEIAGDMTGSGMNCGMNCGGPRKGRLAKEQGKAPPLQDWRCVLVGDFTTPSPSLMRELLGMMGAVVEDLFTLAPCVTSVAPRRKKGPQTSSRKITFITEQSYELLDEKSREALTKQNGPVVDRTWLFDSISWYAPQDFVAYDAIRRR